MTFRLNRPWMKLLWTSGGATATTLPTVCFSDTATVAFPDDVPTSSSIAADGTDYQADDAAGLTAILTAAEGFTKHHSVLLGVAVKSTATTAGQVTHYSAQVCYSIAPSPPAGPQPLAPPHPLPRTLSS